MVIYRVNEKDMTVEQIWQYGKERGAEWYSWVRGSAMLIPNGNRMGSSDVFLNNSSHAITTEVDEGGSLVWEAYITTKDATSNFKEYRTHRLPIYRYSDNDPHIGESAVNLIPQNILAKYGFVLISRKTKMANILILLAVLSPGLLAGLYYLKITNTKKIKTLNTIGIFALFAFLTNLLSMFIAWLSKGVYGNILGDYSLFNSFQLLVKYMLLQCEFAFLLSWAVAFVSMLFSADKVFHKNKVEKQS
jgi:hypothetical protein